jgi:hypothetical protein
MSSGNDLSRSRLRQARRKVLPFSCEMHYITVMESDKHYIS